ncbi:MAG: polysaccharide deacetylase family protein [Oscillospiraceae bacterium]|nr:polysaccharide deacetylase family protein [Oscillospiraceae bacterium]
MRRFFIGCLIISLLLGGTDAWAAENWGLGFPNPGETPVAPATVEELKEFDAYYIGSTEEQVIYLTFDGGYENGNTEPILDTLQAHNVPAAFFLVGTYIQNNPALIRRMVDEGHTVANHTMGHPNMAAITDKERFRRELEEPAAHYKAIIGQPMPKFYRPPEGKYSVENLKLAKELGYITLFWSLAYVDWNDDAQPSKEQAFGKLLPRIHPGAIVLLHNTSATNRAILGELIQAYKDMGYRFGCISEFETA